MTQPALRAQPLLCVADVPAASRWYQRNLGLVSPLDPDHPHRAGYDLLTIDGLAVLQLHDMDQADHHGAMAAPGVPLGNGVAVWFSTRDFDAVVALARAGGATVQTDVHTNPNSGNCELWLRDDDGYLVVISSEPSPVVDGS